jgi:transposase
MKIYHIGEAAKALAKKNQNKRVDKRLQVILLRYEGLRDSEIGEKLGYHRALTSDEEAEILEKLEEKAKKGEVVTTREIKAELDKSAAKTPESPMYTGH